MQPTNKLKEFRLRAGLSRNRLGARAGLDGQTIYRIENGASTQVPSARSLAQALSEFLNEAVTIDDLFPALEKTA